MNHFNHEQQTAQASDPNPFSMDLLTTTSQFDEVLPEPVRVSLVEYQEKPTGEVDEQGNPIVIRVPRVRTTLINTYVPMRVLHSMMASQEKMKRMQGLQAQAASGQLSEENQQLMLEWMIAQVLAVWKLTEPNMTADKLTEGLSYQKVFGLFGLFFGDLLKQLANQRKNG